MNIPVSLFVEPDPAQPDAAKSLGVSVIELHTGSFVILKGRCLNPGIVPCKRCSYLCGFLGLECHAGHGLGSRPWGQLKVFQR